MSRNSKILFTVAGFFVAIVIAFTIHMASNTSAPWKDRKKTMYKYQIDHHKKVLKDTTHVERRK
jgi:hypothetical protein